MKLQLDSQIDKEEIGKILLQRLHQLHDRGWMIALLERAIAKMSHTPLGVEDYKIHFSKVHPKSHVNVFMEVSIINLANGQKSWHRFSCIFLPTLKFPEKSTVLLSSVQRKNLESIGICHYETQLHDPAMILRAFPLDPNLNGLIPATDMDKIKELFSEVYQETQALTYEVLNYKPGCSCTLQYTQGEISAYGKLYSVEDFLQSSLSLEKSWELSCKSGGLWVAARPLKTVAKWGFVLQEAVPGRQLREVFF